MKTLIRCLVVLLAFAVGGEESAEPLTALGYTAGEALPDKEPVFESGGLKIYTLPGRAGLDEVNVAGTDKTGVCKVVGTVAITTPRGDDYGIRHKSAADDLAKRVEAKVGNPPTNKHDFTTGGFAERNPDQWPLIARQGNATYIYFWSEDDAGGFQTIMVKAMYERISVGFEFPCFAATKEEQDAALTAEF